MHPQTYATLYGPARPVPEPRRNGVVILTGVVWSTTIVRWPGWHSW